MNINISNNYNVSDAANTENFADNINTLNNKTQNTTNYSSQLNSLSSMPEGTIFNGKITDISNNIITIQLNDGSNISAKMAEFINTNVGDVLDFLVQQNNSKGIVIKPSNNNVNEVISKILDNNGFISSEKNYQIANALLQNNLQTDKQSMQRIMQAAYKFPDVSVDNLVAMSKLNIPITQENINIYEQYQNNQHQLSNDINNLADNIGKFITQFDDNTFVLSDSKITTDISKIVNSIFSESIIGNSKQIENNNAALPNNAENAIKNNNAALPNSVENVIEKGYDVALKYSSNESDLPNFDNISASLKQLADALEINYDAVSKLQDVIGEDNSKIIDTIIGSSSNKSEILNQLAEALFNGNFKENDIDLLKNSFVDVIKASIKSELSIDPEKMKNPKEVDELYSSNSNKLSKLINEFSQNSSGNKGDFTNSAKDMQSKMEFIQNINNMYAYAQLPVSVSGAQFNSELFVYMNKKLKNSEKKDISAMLHLDMDNLGPTDVHITLSNNEVITRFYVDDEESARIIDEHMNMLQEALKTNGFNLHNETINRNNIKNQSDNNLVVNEIFQNELEQSVKRFTFDVRR